MVTIKTLFERELRVIVILLFMVMAYHAGTMQTDCFGWVRDFMTRHLEAAG